MSERLTRYLDQRRAFDARIAQTVDATRKHELRREAAKLDATINRLQTRITRAKRKREGR